MDSSLQASISEWLRMDKNPETREEIETLVSQNNIDELAQRMRDRIQFGTAGLRGRMEAGWSRMNDLTVIQASQGLCAYVIRVVNNAASRGVVIGHDHRHHSAKWARLTAAAFIRKGVIVYLYQGLVHTPMVPFGVKSLEAACGVMITASHNPKQDNGYKVYWENAVQIISPHDLGIAESIKENLMPQTWDIDAINTSPLCLDRTKELVDHYFAKLSQLCSSRLLSTKTNIKFVNTSMHGVSHAFMKRAFETFGLEPFSAVQEQMRPDPEFHTVKFPNPEEQGALDLALKTAIQTGAQYVLAQDPDSDRFSAAERGLGDKWIHFTGDQLGILFASAVLQNYKESGRSLERLAMVASTVSSKMLESMAEVEGFKFVECLTGFKFIGNVALNLARQGYVVPFGYEEAIGYMFGSDIRDKDGVAASMMFVELVTSLHARGQTASGLLEELYQRYGYFQTRNSYFICHDAGTIDAIFGRLRNYTSSTTTIPNYPHTIAGLEVTSVRDLTIGYDSTNPPTYTPSLPRSSGHMIQFRAKSTENRTKITLTLRTSGTEPKIKYYLEGNGTDISVVDQKLRLVVHVLAEEWLESTKNNLGQP